MTAERRKTAVDPRIVINFRDGFGPWGRYFRSAKLRQAWQTTAR